MGFTHRACVRAMILDDANLNELRNCQAEGHDPNGKYKLDGPIQVHHVLPEWMANGYISLHGERRDGQHCGVGGRFRDHSQGHADGGTEGILIWDPHVVQVERHSGDKQQQVGNGQIEEVVVGGRVHRLVLVYYYARDDITQYSQNEDGCITNCGGHEERQGILESGVIIK